MALNSEEFRKRRQERDALRRKQLQQQKKVMVGLLIAAGVLLLVGILIFAVTSSSRGNSDPTDPSTEAAMSGTQGTDATEPAEGKTVIRFAATGDLNITDKVVAAGGENYDYAYIFRDVIPVLAGADLAVVNLEGQICGEPYGTKTASAPESLLKALKDAGVDMIQMANSKSIINGVGDLATTLKNIRAAGMEPLGAYVDNEEFDAYEGYSVFEVQGIRVGVIAMTKGMDGLALPSGNEFSVNVMYDDYATTYQEVADWRIEELLKDVNLEKPDVVIALLHWGSEYNNTQGKTQKTIRKMMLEEGVDAIIGTHPHFVQQIEQDAETGAIVAYSLGDFLGDGSRSGTEYSIILELEITKDHATGETTVTGYDYVPIYAVKNSDGSMQILRIREAIAAYENGEIGCVSKSVYTSMVAALAQIEKKVTPTATE